MKIFITGGAGFIGSHLVAKLIDNNEVTVYDNLSSGRLDFLSPHINKTNFHLITGDLLDVDKLTREIAKHDFVWHLAANPDIRYGIANTNTDLVQGTMVTYNVLEAMRRNKITRIAFSSSSVVYGEPTVTPTPEDYGPLVPISLYGASKLACEGLISGFCGTFAMQSWIFRFANIVGARATHGILFDFINKLRHQPTRLEILGDGNQLKSYLHISDCIQAMLFAVAESKETVNIFNLAAADNILISRIAEIVVETMGLKNVNFHYTGGRRGWPGDVFYMELSPAKINKLGWKATYTSLEAVRRAMKELVKNNCNYSGHAKP